MKMHILSLCTLVCISTALLIKTEVDMHDMQQDEEDHLLMRSNEEIEEALEDIESKIDALTEQVDSDSSMIELILSKVCLIETSLDVLT